MPSTYQIHKSVDNFRDLIYTVEENQPKNYSVHVHMPAHLTIFIIQFMSVCLLFSATLFKTTRLFCCFFCSTCNRFVARSKYDQTFSDLLSCSIYINVALACTCSQSMLKY